LTLGNGLESVAERATDNGFIGVDRFLNFIHYCVENRCKFWYGHGFVSVEETKPLPIVIQKATPKKALSKPHVSTVLFYTIRQPRKTVAYWTIFLLKN
jgi:hypothetical protein